MKKILFLISFLVMSYGYLEAQTEIALYPNGAKESNEITDPEKREGEDWVSNVTHARMYAYLVPEEKASGAAVVICPGGGYAGICVDKEGTEFAKYFNDLGISAFVLYYRMPNQHSLIPLTDAQTAIEMVRKNAKKWNIDKNKIGVAGFSAGGHLASTVGTHFTKKNRPDFMILLYPVITFDDKLTHKGSRENLIGKTPTDEVVKHFSNELQIKKNTPTTFIIHSKDDKTVPIQNSHLFEKALKEKGISVEFHVYENGGHGYGLRKNGIDADSWPEELKKWLENNNLSK